MNVETPMCSLRKPWPVIIIAVSVAITAFAANLVIAIRLGNMEVVDQYDVLFNADTGARIKCIVENKCGGRSSFSHPTLAVFLNPPIQFTAWALKHAGLVGTDEVVLRRFFSLLVCPLASALKAPTVFFLLLLLGISVSQASLLSFLSIVSFSQLVFGSIPESFALSGFLIALVYLLAIHSMRSGNQHLWPWIILGILVTGITVSNLMIVLILFVTVKLYCNARIRTVLLETVILVVIVVIPIAVLPTTVRDTYQLRAISIKGGINYTKAWMKPKHIVNRALKTPVTWSHTFAAPVPEVAPNRRAIRERSKYNYRFILSPAKVFSCRDPLTLFLLLLFVWGALSYIKAPRFAKWICGASLVIIAFNWMLHSAWGVDLFLYSQHWQLSLVVLMAGPCLWEESLVRKLAVFIVIVLIVAVIVQNSHTASAMLLKLESVHR